MRHSKWLLVLSLAVVSSLAWACGGGGEEEPSATGGTPQAATPAGEATPQEGDGQFSDLAEKFAAATFKATYTVSGHSGTVVTQGSMIWYKKGDNLRMDISGEFQGEQTTATLITRPDQSYMCTDVPDFGGATCFAVPGESGASEMMVDLENTLNDPDVEIVSTTSRTIVGEDTTCYTMRTSDSEGDTELCLSNEGVPLFSRETAEGEEMSLEATAFDRDVSDSDFEPPYPLADLSATPTGQ